MLWRLHHSAPPVGTNGMRLQREAEGGGHVTPNRASGEPQRRRREMGGQKKRASNPKRRRWVSEDDHHGRLTLSSRNFPIIPVTKRGKRELRRPWRRSLISSDDTNFIAKFTCSRTWYAKFERSLDDLGSLSGGSQWEPNFSPWRNNTEASGLVKIDDTTSLLPKGNFDENLLRKIGHRYEQCRKEEKGQARIHVFNRTSWHQARRRLNASCPARGRRKIPGPGMIVSRRDRRIGIEGRTIQGKCDGEQMTGTYEETHGFESLADTVPLWFPLDRSRGYCSKSRSSFMADTPPMEHPGKHPAQNSNKESTTDKGLR
nr:uncharacterized protein LOC109175269 [Ipomoea batatas]